MRWKVSLPDFITSDGRVIPVEPRRRKGTRHLRLSLSTENRIVLSLPWHCSERAGRKFIEQHRLWLEARLAEVPEVVDVGEWLQGSPWLSAFGQRFGVQFREAAGRRAGYQMDRECCRVSLSLPCDAGGADLAGLIRQFAREVLAARTEAFVARHGLAINGLSVRNQSSRWGSCSSKRGISLNWRLVLIAPELQDYVILHELAHLTELNHSARFWQLLDRYDPDRVRHEAELNAITPSVLRVRG